MNRRMFISGACLSAAGAWLGRAAWDSVPAAASEISFLPPAATVIPVVGDGKWTWTAPPREARGYLEPRRYTLSVGIELQGLGESADMISMTPVPIECPEQQIEKVEFETDGCSARIVPIAPGSNVLELTAPTLSAGGLIKATAHFTLLLSKQYFAYTADQFPAQQMLPTDVRRNYLQDSPGIQTSSKPVRDLAAELTRDVDNHPWVRAEKFWQWVRRNIQPLTGPYTSVTTALDTRRGDCEEMAGVFIALCRAVGIPARLVWVPNHAWAEFYLVDRDKQGHWIPAHTACYPWFGYTGAHELVLQKGDRLVAPVRLKHLRLMDDWLRATGRLPRPRFFAELTSVANEPGGDAGPGARRKTERGEWKPLGLHPDEKYQRP
ncbi:MAG: transglutaminase domain-containing protein [Planctomycetes bacterium]|nr:transglutaminase domain-containing protein [Planctomycetota bacterium]